jgi:hypothetical protein
MGNTARKLATGLRAAFPRRNSRSAAGDQPERIPFWSQTAPGWILPIILASGWELLARAGFIDISLFSSPSQIVPSRKQQPRPGTAHVWALLSW